MSAQRKHTGNGKSEGGAAPSAAPTRKEHIFVGLPTGDHFYNTHLCAFTDHLANLSDSPTHKYTYTMCRKSGFKPIDKARNIITREFLESDATRLWFWDADVKPNIKAMEMLERPEPVVAGMYPVMSANDEEVGISWGVYKINPKTKRFSPIRPTDSKPFLTDGAATGAMLIHRNVFDLPGIKLNSKRWWRNLYDDQGEITYSDDLDFCVRLWEAKQPVLVMPNLVFGHLKTIDVLAVEGLMRYAYKLGEQAAEARFSQPSSLIHLATA